MKLAKADEIAAAVVELLAPVCERIEVVGSVRRRSAEPKDVEVLCVAMMAPNNQAEMFGGGARVSRAGETATADDKETATRGTRVPLATKNLLTDKLRELRGKQILTPRLSSDGKEAWGERYVRAWFHREKLASRADEFGERRAFRDAYGVAVTIFIVATAEEFEGHPKWGETMSKADVVLVKEARWARRQGELPERPQAGTPAVAGKPVPPGNEDDRVTPDVPCASDKHDWSGPFVEAGNGIQRVTCRRCRMVHPGAR